MVVDGRARASFIRSEKASLGWIGTRRNSFKDQHLGANSYVSLAYIADTAQPVYIDCLGVLGR